MLKRKIDFRSRKCVILGFIFGLLLISTLFQNNLVDQKIVNTTSSSNNNTVSVIGDLENQGTYYQDYIKEWLTNGNFTGGISPWTNTTAGDNSDIKASYDNNAANVVLNGIKGSKQVILSKNTKNDWKPFNKTFIIPNNGYGVDDNGCYAKHNWDEGADQTQNTPEINWRYNVSMPVDMSDYKITSVSFKAVMNATTDYDIDAPGDRYACYRGGTKYDLFKHSTYDYAQFYVEISNMNISTLHTYRIAYNQTTMLGKDPPPLSTYPPTVDSPYYHLQRYIDTYGNQAIIDAITNVLTVDKGHNNFTVVLGIYIYCEDNVDYYDHDNWKDLRFKTLNLTFTYEKKMDYNTSLSWNQIGNKISGGEETQVTNANLNFKYKINNTLSQSISPNSEFRIIINGTQHSETIKLFTATALWKDAKTGGFDVTSLIKKNVNISLSIQVYLAESPFFPLSKGYKISIDNVTLKITYSIASSEIPTLSKLYLNKEDKTQSRYLTISKGENVNITVKYNDSTGFIPDALVNLTGYGTPKALYEDSIHKQYNITISTNSIAYGENYLKVTATKPLYQTQEILFTLNVIKRDTYLDVYVNNTNIESFTYYNCSIKQYLNVTAFYRDSKTNNFITGAELLLIEAGVGIPHVLNPHPIFSNQYYITYLSDDLGKGISFLQVTGEKDNYTKAVADFSVFVTERATNMKVLLNGTTPPTKTLIELEDKIIITANFTDAIDFSYILNANVSILGGFYGNLTKFGNLYNIILFGKNLTQQAINFLTIYAYKANYQPQSYTFVVEVIQRQTNLNIFFDGVNVTNDPSTAPLPIGKSINIMVNYFDKYNSVVGANVRLILGTISYQLAEDPITHRYSTTINTISFGLGITVPHIIAERVNYLVKTENLRIQVRKINTLITTDDEEDTITVKPGENVHIKIEVRNLDFGGKISKCEATFDWKYGDGELDEDEDGIYDFNLENVPEGTHKITITVFKSGGLYDFQEYEITLNVVREKGESLLYMILFIAAVVGAGGLASYFVAYYYVLKYPKPVRKVRKYRRTLKRAKTPKTDITDREKAFKEAFKNLTTISALKSKVIEKIIIPDKLLQKSTEKMDSTKIPKNINKK